MLASERGEIGLPAAMEALLGGASALDAVEIAVRLVEANEADHYVGVGGLPNLLGEVELDAGVMVGDTRRVGAVAAVRGFPHPVSIARAVLEQLPQHVLLAGAGAERFADEAGLPRGETLTDEAKRLWQEGLESDDADESTWAGERRYREQALARIQAMAAPTEPYGTVNILACDAAGRLAVAVSTSGYPWKYPGRVGDSPLPGAGFYCDDRAGAGSCTGRGELAIRAGTARRVVDHAGRGLDPADACREALRETLDLPDEFRAPLQALCLLPDGRHGGAATREGATYGVMTAEDREPRILPRAVA
jgi:isoaspartyl peptidase/L-asparaginase-like protein (Ntn-hydrolase superfamily)